MSPVLSRVWPDGCRNMEIWLTPLCQYNYRRERCNFPNHAFLLESIVIALSAIGTVLQAPNDAIALLFNGGTAYVYHFDVDGTQHFIDVRTNNHIVTNISTRDLKFSTPEGIRLVTPGLRPQRQEEEVVESMKEADRAELWYMTTPSATVAVFGSGSGFPCLNNMFYNESVFLEVEGKMADERIYKTAFAGVYPMYVQKLERKKI
jgi:hypothetical protein